MTNVIIGEFVGTILLVLLGDGVCANVTLNNSGFKAGNQEIDGYIMLISEMHSFDQLLLKLGIGGAGVE